MESLVSFTKFHLCTLFFFSIFPALAFVIRRSKSKHISNPDNLPFPPGPPPLPILGNLFDFARENESAAYFQLAEKYGDLVFMSVLGKNVLFVNSFKASCDLFEKHSANYSDRNESVMIQLMGWDWSFGHMRYGDRWKVHRRMFHRQFQQPVASIFWPVQLKEAHSLIRRLLETPDNLNDHLRHSAASFIMKVIYGITVAPQDDHYISIAEKALEGMAQAAKPGAFLVDILPFLKHLPEWMPGAGFQRKAHEWKNATLEMRDEPFSHVQAALKNGTAEACFVSNLLNDVETTGSASEQIEIIKGCAGLAYAAGAESTVSTLSSFVLAVITHPEVQVKAQKELDSVTRQRRLPEFSDRPSLPYITAIVKELLRWNPVAPLGLPHMVTHDDEYNGYFIPAGTMVVGNSWKILHDPAIYPYPQNFNPDRFIHKDGDQQFSSVDPLSVAFGYGRRRCPGRYTAEAQVWISVASILSVFDIQPRADEMGLPLKIEPAFTSGMICHPKPFKFSITPRGEFARELIEQTGDFSL